jgi:hypothetical protein
LIGYETNSRGLEELLQMTKKLAKQSVDSAAEK